jgi:alpha-L-rhamnosidase
MKFSRAVSVWPEGRGSVWNQLVGFYSAFDSSSLETVMLRVTAADYYRVWCNGQFAGYGPARTAHGYARVDEWSLDGLLQDGTNHVAIEVLSYGVVSYAHAMQPPFLQAEVVSRDTVLAATSCDAGPDAFSARICSERVQKVERYSGQRPFAEAYRLKAGCYEWRVGKDMGPGVACEAVDQSVLLPRGVRYQTFDRIVPETRVACGPAVFQDPPPAPLRLRVRDNVNPDIGLGFRIADYDVDILGGLHPLAFPVEDDAVSVAGECIIRNMAADTHVLYDFGVIRAGFLGVRLRCEQSATVYLVFDEQRRRMDAPDYGLGVGAIRLDLEPGSDDFESIDAYSLRYLRVVALGADVTLEELYLREFAHPATDHASLDTEDADLRRIFAAARQTFRNNAPDLFLDCAGRERGGWPCDAYFTARVEKLLTGETRVERNFLENFLLPDSFRNIPAGMLPHCYPSDRNMPGGFIPNWALWFFIQFAEYAERSSDPSLLTLAEKRFRALLAYLSSFLNPEGLLEDLAGWVFVEHSPANNYTSGVNHPTNLVYAAALDAGARLFGCEEWARQAAGIRDAVRRESWDGRWFADQSVRVDGALQRTAGRTETCQYHAFRFGIADPQRDAGLWQRLLTEYGPFGEAHKRCWSSPVAQWNHRYAPWDEGATWPTELIPANLFYGGMLRLELLARYGEQDRLLREIKAIFGPQAELGGTLWEGFDSACSCSHGFASRVAEQILMHLSGTIGTEGSVTGKNSCAGNAVPVG